MNRIYKFGEDFHSEGGALTLDAAEVREEHHAPAVGYFQRVHPDGWLIAGNVVEDYYEWVNDFCAIHPTLGQVHGNFEAQVSASSEEAFRDFYEKHKPRAWDYQDI